MPGGFRVQTGKMTVNDLSQQVRHILRKLVRAPLFTITTVGTLALGIGANAAIFTIVNGVLLKPLPFEDPDELVGLWHVAQGLGFDESRPVNMAPAMYFTYRDEGRAFEEVGSEVPPVAVPLPMLDPEPSVVPGVGAS